MSEPSPQGAERDLFRDTWVRYLGHRGSSSCGAGWGWNQPAGVPPGGAVAASPGLNGPSRPGYANEVGEAFRSMVPAAVVWLSYGVSSSYVLADAIDKGKKAGEVPSPEAGRSTRVTVAVVDTFVWQALASVAIPGFTINRVCAASLYVLGTATRWPLAARKWTTTALGLLVIPVIIHPIDRSVDFLLDSSLRKLYPSVEKPSSS
ncbi:hypothetical protein QTO34_011946 [Cnephaeus nilssonii]|uniref:Mitochondrial fission process protein 1 n=1 Tax=Cnephaeus nilssonii TaxID=3371016 RepID=A0AA40HC50_CNENI|nr:hypothetical protein QTO34_011946 [Eptesicus nilssonii]